MKLPFNLDDLPDWKFEQLCQALLKKIYGDGIESRGGNRDGGIDAYSPGSLCYPGSELQAGPFLFQVKFVRAANAAGANPGGRLLDSVTKECGEILKKMSNNKWVTPKVYSLMTNFLVNDSLREKIVEKFRNVLPECAIYIKDGGDICAMIYAARWGFDRDKVCDLDILFAELGALEDFHVPTSIVSVNWADLKRYLGLTASFGIGKIPKNHTAGNWFDDFRKGRRQNFE